MHYQFESVPENQEFIILDDVVFSVNQIKNGIVRDFNKNNSNLNFCRKNKFLSRYFREVNNQGIFNRIEWKFWLKEDTKCELFLFNKTQQVEELQIRIILDFASTNADSSSLKVLLDFSPLELELEEKPANNYVNISKLKYINEQKIPNYHSLSSEKICI